MAKYRYRKFPQGYYADDNKTLKYLCTLHKNGKNGWIAQESGMYGAGKTRDEAVDDYIENQRDDQDV